ncbi:hypothetical protein BD408DRAFT_435422 [Parasitella parasitica]|nr:hypothetical protein BD408DRAFT_435422 [Parasitella parasitica]
MHGGSIEYHARFALEVVDSVVKAFGADRTPIRFSPGRHPDLVYLLFMEADAFFKDKLADILEPYRAR